MSPGARRCRRTCLPLPGCGAGGGFEDAGSGGGSQPLRLSHSACALTTEMRGFGKGQKGGCWDSTCPRRSTRKTVEAPKSQCPWEQVCKRVRKATCVRRDACGAAACREECVCAWARTSERTQSAPHADAHEPFSSPWVCPYPTPSGSAGCSLPQESLLRKRLGSESELNREEEKGKLRLPKPPNPAMPHPPSGEGVQRGHGTQGPALGRW